MKLQTSKIQVGSSSLTCLTILGFLLIGDVITDMNAELKHSVVINLITNNLHHQIISVFTIVETQTGGGTQSFLLYCQDLLSPGSEYRDNFSRVEPSTFIFLKDLKCEIEVIDIPELLSNEKPNDIIGVTKCLTTSSANREELISIRRDTILDTLAEFSYCDVTKLNSNHPSKQSPAFQLKVCFSDKVFSGSSSKNNLPSDQSGTSSSSYMYEDVFKKRSYIISPLGSNSTQNGALISDIVEVENKLMNTGQLNKLMAYGINTGNRKPRAINRDKTLFLLLCIAGVLFLVATGVGVYFFFESRRSSKDNLPIKMINSMNEAKQLEDRLRKILIQIQLNRMQIRSMFEDLEASKKSVDLLLLKGKH